VVHDRLALVGDGESLRLLRELAETYPDDELFLSTGDTPGTRTTPAG